MKTKKVSSHASASKSKASRFWQLKLYVMDQSPKSVAALTNLRRICDGHLKGRYRITVIDLLKMPQLASGDQILATPTVVRRLPVPWNNHRQPLRHRPSARRPGSARCRLTGAHILKTTKVSRAKRALEEALATRPEGKHFLKLYVAGATARSRQALRHVYRLCEAELKDSYELEVIDVYQQPELARDNQIIATPTLIKEFPSRSAASSAT